MDNNNFVKIPTEIVLGNKTFEENKKYVKIMINNRYNFLNKNNDFISSMWFSKIDGDFVNGEVVVTKKGGKYNVLKEDGTLLFEDWSYYIGRIYNEDENKDFNSYKIYRSKKEVNIYDGKNGFISDKFMISSNNIGNNMYVITDKEEYIFYDGRNGNVIRNLDFNRIDTFGEKMFIVEKCIDKKWIYNLIDRKGNFLFENWASESPKINWNSNGKSNLIIYGDKNMGYSLLNDDGDMISNEIYDNFIYKPGYNSKNFSLIRGFVFASKGNNITSFNEVGEIVDVENDKLLMTQLFMDAMTS